jgi:amidase
MRPTTSDVHRLAERDYLRLSEDEAAVLRDALDELLADFEELEEVSPRATAGPERDAGWVPDSAENPFNTFTRRCRIEGQASGPLAGRRFAVKDNIAVAGLPTTNASAMSPFTPFQDAVVVERLLEAGATLVGKLNLDDFASGPTGETSWFGPARNPTDPAYSAGGSSGGSGAAVAAGEVDFSLGVDQGGSARIPASFCGVTALKPSYGLVPSQGSTHIAHTMDYVSPIAPTVAEVYDVLRCVAGPDERNPQRPHAPLPALPTELSPASLDGVRFGIVSAGLDPDVCAPEVLDAFAATSDALAGRGAQIGSVDIALWSRAWKIANILLAHLAASILRSEGVGYDHFGALDASGSHAFAVSRRMESDLFPPLIKVWLLGDAYLHERTLNRSYALVHNLRREMRRQIDEALGEWDVLISPGTPTTAPRLHSGVQTSGDLLARVPSAVYNACALNLSGHPALVLPNGRGVGRLPTSLQIVGPYMQDEQLCALAASVEHAIDDADLFQREDRTR